MPSCKFIAARTRHLTASLPGIFGSCLAAVAVTKERRFSRQQRFRTHRAKKEGRRSLSSWYPHPELNRDQRFRKPPLYPFELWGRAWETSLPKNEGQGKDAPGGQKHPCGLVGEHSWRLLSLSVPLPVPPPGGRAGCNPITVCGGKGSGDALVRQPARPPGQPADTRLTRYPSRKPIKPVLILAASARVTSNTANGRWLAGESRGEGGLAAAQISGLEFGPGGR